MLLRGLFALLLLLQTPLHAAPVVEVHTLAQEDFSGKFDPDNAARPGIAIEIMLALEVLDPGLKFVGYRAKGATARVLHELESGQIDVFFGLVKTAERAALYRYLEPPLYTTRGVLVLRRQDPLQVNSWDDLRQLGEAGRILVARGTSHAQHLLAVGGLRVDEEAGGVKANLRKLQAGRGRAYFASDLNIHEEIRVLNLEHAFRVLPIDLWPTRIYAVLSPLASPTLAARLVRALQRLERSGKLTEIRARYGVL